MNQAPLILLTNDDGINSPGLLAVANAVASLGQLLIVAPKTQQTGAGRSFKKLDDRRIHQQSLTVNQEPLTAYSLKGTPAQAVQAAMLNLSPRPIDLVISGINYGENIGTGITISGTVGAALEAAAAGIPALAVSLETPIQDHYQHSAEIDFSSAAYFTRMFAQKVLACPPLPFDVDVLKIDIPASATAQTAWRITSVSRQVYHFGIPSPPAQRGLRVEPGYVTRIDEASLEPESDIRAICFDQVVSVAPLSLNLTSRVGLKTLEQHLSLETKDHHP